MGIVYSALSVSLGYIDYVVYLLNYLSGKNRPKFFSNGWGNEQFLSQVTSLYDCPTEEEFSKTTDVCLESIEWLKEKKYVKDIHSATNYSYDKLIVVKKARFSSPLAHLLPTESKYCYLNLVYPKKFSVRSSTSDSDCYSNTLGSNSSSAVVDPVTVILLPSTGEVGVSERMSMASTLSKTHGWSVIVIKAPYYGTRKPKEQRLHYAQTVADFLLQNISIIEETSVLAIDIQKNGCFSRRTANSQLGKDLVCISGFSWGGAISACSSVTSMIWGGDGRRLACAPYVGSGTRAAVMDGVLNSQVDYDALRKVGENDEQVRDKLITFMSRTQLSNFACKLENVKNGSKTIAVINAIGMLHDHIIRHGYASDFLKELAFLTNDFTKLWLFGGHVWAMIIRQKYQQLSIEKAVGSLIRMVRDR